MNKPKALITGITGQDGSYLAEFLLEKGYEVHGIVRRSSTFNRHNIEHIFDSQEKRDSFLHYGDMSDFVSIMSILEKVRPDEIYNLAAQSHVKVSFEMPMYTAQADALGVLSLLEAVRLCGLKSKIYQASTSEMFSGDSGQTPQSENTSFWPKSPYGAAKLYAFQISRIYRESYGMFVSNGILFNHESPRRGINFVSRKISVGVAQIHAGSAESIKLGNLSAKRDWGFAPEYMEAIWATLQQETPGDYVIGTGESHTVREFAELAFKYAGIDLVWRGSGQMEKGVDAKTGRVLVEIDQNFFRPNEVDYLRADSSRALKDFGWKHKVAFADLVKIMVEADIRKIANGEPIV